MAKQKGIIKLEGTIGDLSFIKTKDGFMAKDKGGVSAEKIKNGASFVRTRENMSEFSTSTGAGKLVRDALRLLLVEASDSRVISRVVELMSQIKNMDPDSDRGKRSVAIGIQQPGAKELLIGFNFNNQTNLKSICPIDCTVDTSTGETTLEGLITGKHMRFPQRATHVNLQSGWARVNFETGSSKSFLSPVVTLPLNQQVNTVSLVPSGTPANTGTDLFVLLVEFYQEINGQAYALNNGLYNALAIVEVV